LKEKEKIKNKLVFINISKIFSQILKIGSYVNRLDKESRGISLKNLNSKFTGDKNPKEEWMREVL